MFHEIHSKNTNLDPSGISWRAFTPRTNCIIWNYIIFLKLANKVINSLDLWKTWFWLYSSGSSEELWTWAFMHFSWTFLIYVWRNFIFQIVGKFNYRPANLISVVSKISEKHVNSKLMDNLFSDFQCGFRYSHITVDLATVICGANWMVPINISKAFCSVWHGDLRHQLKFYGILGRVFNLILSFLSNRRLLVDLNGTFS